MDSFQKQYSEFLRKERIHASVYEGASLIRRYIRVSPKAIHNTLKEHPTFIEQLELEFKDIIRGMIESGSLCDTETVEKTTIAETNSEQKSEIVLPFFVRTKESVKDDLKNILDRADSGHERIVQPTQLVGVLSLPGIIPLRGSPSYEKGKIFGIDLASVVAVLAMLPHDHILGKINQPPLFGKHVLDVCCAPGGKLALLADLTEMPITKVSESPFLSSTSQLPSPSPLSSTSTLISPFPYDLASPELARGWEISRGSVTGVDIDLTRLNVAKSLVMKHGIKSVRLYCDDACEFNERPSSTLSKPTAKGRRMEALNRFSATNESSSNLLLPVWRAGVQIPSNSFVSQSHGGALILGTKRPRASCQGELKAPRRESATLSVQRLKDLGSVATLASISEEEALESELVSQFIEQLLGMRAPGDALAGCPCVESSSLRRIVRYRSTKDEHSYCPHLTTRDKKISVEYERRIRTIDSPLLANGTSETTGKEFKADSGQNNVYSAPDWYDGVLVDAECTHDGSIRHLQKAVMNSTGGKDAEKMLDADRLEGLDLLQRTLLSNGFRLLKSKTDMSSSALSYSTCSFAMSQNEDVVAWLLATQTCATIEEIPWNSTCLTVKGTPTSDQAPLQYKKCFSCPRKVLIADQMLRIMEQETVESLGSKTLDEEEDSTLKLLLNHKTVISNENWQALKTYVQRLREAYDQIEQKAARFGPEVGTSGLFVCRINKNCRCLSSPDASNNSQQQTLESIK